MKFSGTIHAKVDAKGRVFFPSSYRRQLPNAEAELVLRRDVYATCLAIYSREAWEAEVSVLSLRLNRRNPTEAMLFRQFLASAETFTLDAAGRFLVPRHRLDEVGICHEVVFVGVDDHVELWNPETLNAALLPVSDFATRMEQVVGEPSVKATMPCDGNTSAATVSATPCNGDSMPCGNDGVPCRNSDTASQ